MTTTGGRDSQPDFLSRTNLRDLIDAPIAEQIDVNQPIAPPEVKPREPLRSTTDPLQSNFAVADIAGALHHSRQKPAVKVFAFVFLGGPMILFGCFILALAITNDALGPMRTFLGIAFGIGLIAFWPYLIFVRGRGGAKPER